MKDAITFLNTEKISDEIMYFSKDIVVRFNVNMARKREDGSRAFCYGEYGYESTKYTDFHKPLVTARRSMSYYLSIESKANFENNIWIFPKHMIYFRTQLAEVSKWFGTLFKKKKDKVVITNDFTPIRINISDGKYLELTPTVLEYDNKQLEGIRISISGNTYVDISIDKYFEFLYFVTDLNMHSLASNMVTFMAAEIGQNTQFIEGGFNSNMQRTKSFFDN